MRVVLLTDGPTELPPPPPPASLDDLVAAADPQQVASCQTQAESMTGGNSTLLGPVMKACLAQFANLAEPTSSEIEQQPLTQNGGPVYMPAPDANRTATAGVLPAAATTTAVTATTRQCRYVHTGVTTDGDKDSVDELYCRNDQGEWNPAKAVAVAQN